GMKRGRAGARIPLALGGGVPRLSRHCCLARAAKFSPGRRHAPEVVTTSTQGRLFSPWPPLVAPRAPRPGQHRPPPARGRGALLPLPRIYFQGSVAKRRRQTASPTAALKISRLRECLFTNRRPFS